METLKIGDKVHPTIGKGYTRKGLPMVGEIMSIKNNLATVKWDSQVQPNTYHINFLRKIG